MEFANATKLNTKFGFAPVGMTNLRVAAHLGSGEDGGTEPNIEGPHHFQKANLDKYG
jgi:hypothetical protein